MKVLQINIFGNLSTGRIAVDLYHTLKAEGHEGVIAYARNTLEKGVPGIRIGSRWDVYYHGIMTRLTDRAGFYSKRATGKLIEEIKAYNPDIIHLHNIHGYYLNIEILFNYLKEAGKPVVWTLHDCWAFTGHCCHYSAAGCEKWKKGCFDCEQSRAYPASFTDRSEENYKWKKKVFPSLPGLHLVAVSEWLKAQVKQSFLCQLPCRVIYNGIDTGRFRPLHSDFRKRYGLEKDFIILGVASTWSRYKGLEDFITLAGLLGEGYRVVLVGVSKEDKKRLPDRILGLERTNSVEELAELYSAADVFFNASREETFGLPTAEAIACHTPAIVYDATALPEVITKENGVVVPMGDLQAVKKVIEEIRREEKKFSFGEFAYDKKEKYQEYLKLYEEIMEGVKE